MAQKENLILVEFTPADISLLRLAVSRMISEDSVEPVDSLTEGVSLKLASINQAFEGHDPNSRSLSQGHILENKVVGMSVIKRWLDSDGGGRSSTMMPVQRISQSQKNWRRRIHKNLVTKEELYEVAYWLTMCSAQILSQDAYDKVLNVLDAITGSLAENHRSTWFEVAPMPPVTAEGRRNPVYDDCGRLVRDGESDGEGNPGKESSVSEAAELSEGLAF